MVGREPIERCECGSHQGGDGMVMELAKGMCVDQAHRSEPGASRNQGDEEAAAWEAGRGTDGVVSWRPREGSKGQILGLLNKAAIPAGCNWAICGMVEKNLDQRGSREMKEQTWKPRV